MAERKSKLIDEYSMDELVDLIRGTKLETAVELFTDLTQYFYGCGYRDAADTMAREIQEKVKDYGGKASRHSPHGPRKLRLVSDQVGDSEC